MGEVLRRCRELQRTELDMLEAMYSPSELTFATETVDGITYRLLTHFTIKLKVNDKRIDVTVSMPQLYPVQEHPTVYIRSQGDFYDKEINALFRDWILLQDFGFPMINEVATWVLDTAPPLAVVVGMPAPVKRDEKKAEKFSRYFIRSHHIYSDKKRSFITNTAKDLKLNGFLMSGKPGVIIMEGRSSDCEGFWAAVKGLGWQKIQLVENEEVASEKDFKLQTFKEVNLTTPGSYKTTDASELKALLVEAGLGEHFNNLYGL